MKMVSVIMNCLNCSKYLREAIDSVYAQTFKDWEIIFWDNASTDNSAEIARSYDSRLRYFRGDETVPLYAARNLALKQAKGEYIAFLDCDDMWLPNKLKLQVKEFEKNKTLGLIYTNVEILERDGSKRIPCKGVQPSGKVFGELLENYYIYLQSVMISRVALESLEDWFDDCLHTSGDADLFLRIAHDWEVIYLPQVTAIYREHGGNMSYKRINNFISEIEYIINKLSNLYPDFSEEYESEIISCKMRAQKSVAVLKWKAGNNSLARKQIFSLIKSVITLFPLLLLTIIPYSIVRRTSNILSKIYSRLIP